MIKNLKGMTLVEVITAVSILFIVAGIAYAGICTGGNILTKATDLKNASMDEEQMIDNNKADMMRENVTAVYVLRGENDDDQTGYSVLVEKISGEKFEMYEPCEETTAPVTDIPEDSSY